MKKTIALFVMLCLLLSVSIQAMAAVTVSPQGSGLSLEVPDTYTVLTPSTLEEEAALLEKISQTPASMAQLLESGGYYFIALSENLQYQISLSRTSDALSQAAYNLLDLSIDQRDRVKESMIGSLLEKNAPLNEIERDGALFYRVVDRPEKPETSLPPIESILSASSTVSVAESQLPVSSADPAASEPSSVSASSSSPPVSSASEPPATPQSASIYYISIFNGAYYTLCLTDLSGELNDNAYSQIDYVFDSFQFSVDQMELKKTQTRLDTTLVVIAVIVILALAIAVWAIFSIRAQIQRENLESSWRRKSRRRPRR